MEILKIIIVFVLAYVIGVIGWAQIVGSFQNLKTRGTNVIITIVLWLAIIAGSLIIVIKFFPATILGWVIAMVISLVQVLRSGKIE